MKRIKIIAGISLFLIFLVGCETEKRFPPKGYIPNTPTATSKLEAQYFWSPQNKISSPYWKAANYVEVKIKNIETKNLYGDGILNATGTYNGLNDFNKGNDPLIKLKAGYNDEYLFILVEWKDTTANADLFTWIWDGPVDKLKNDSADNWTSQKNHDNISLLFDKETSDEKDVWKWSLAYTAPFDMALNLNADRNGVTDEVLDKPFYWNSSGSTNRSGPAYEWNGERQEILLPGGSLKILDPAYYLLDSNKMDINGDVEAGQNVFNNIADCRFCHGPNGNGIPDGYTFGPPLNLNYTNKYTREGLVEYIGSEAHEGRGFQYWGRISNNITHINNLIAFMRGIAGIPAHILKVPVEEPFISAISNISVGGISSVNKEYKVLFIRKLNSEDPEDVSFDPQKTYSLSIQLSDNDDINYIGSDGTIELIFKSNKL